MNITVLFMVSVAFLLALFFVGAYLWALSRGQFDDLETPAYRMLKDDDINKITRERTKIAPDCL